MSALVKHAGHVEANNTFDVLLLAGATHCAQEASYTLTGFNLQHNAGTPSYIHTHCWCANKARPLPSAIHHLI